MPTGVYKRTEYHKNIIRLGRLGSVHSDETKQKIGDAHRGKQLSVEHRRKISESHSGMSGKKHTLATRNKMSGSHSGKMLSSEHKQKISESRIGDKNPNWAGGISRFPYSFDFDEKLKALIRERDNDTCQLCDKTQDELKYKLEVHHIDYDKQNSDPSNLITLCKGCNCKVNHRRSYWRNFFNKRMKLIESA